MGKGYRSRRGNRRGYVTPMEIAILLLTITACLGAFLFDLSKGKIPNLLVYPLWLLGLVINFAMSGTDGLIFSLKGLLVAFLLLFPFFALGAMGAGDAKLAMAIGALKGWVFCLYAVLYSFVFGMAIALAIVIWRGEFIKRLKLIGMMLKNFFIGVFLRQSPWSALKQKGQMKFKFGLAIAIAGLWVLALEYMQIEYRFLH